MPSRLEEDINHLHNMLHEIRIGIRYLVKASQKADATEQRKLNKAYDEAIASAKRADDALSK